MHKCYFKCYFFFVNYFEVVIAKKKKKIVSIKLDVVY